MFAPEIIQPTKLVNMKKIAFLFPIAAIVLSLVIVSCKKDDPAPSDVNTAGQTEITAPITTNTTWSASK
jgi:hypothetical protein